MVSVEHSQSQKTLKNSNKASIIYPRHQRMYCSFRHFYVKLWYYLNMSKRSLIQLGVVLLFLFIVITIHLILSSNIWIDVSIINGYDINNKSNVSNNYNELYKPLSFIHIPKTGGTTIEKISKNHKCCEWGMHYWKSNHLHPKQISNQLCKHSLHKCCCQWMWHIPPVYLYDLFGKKNRYNLTYYDLNNRDLFAIIRNPYTRLISEYWWQTRKTNWQNKIIVQYLKSINLWNQTDELLNKDKNKNMDIFCDRDRFNAWIRFRLNMSDYTNINEYNLWNNECVSNCHLIPQWRFCFNHDKNRKICKYILHQENLQNEFNQLMEMYNLDKNISIHGKDHQNTNKRKGKCVNVQPYTINKDEMELFINAYRDDFILFGYDIDHINITYV